MSKKAKYNLVKIVVALCVVLCVVLTVFELGATYRILKATEVDGTEYSVAEYNWMYTNNVYEIYNNYYSQYGQLASYFFNPQGGLSEQVYDQETGKTWAEYLKEYTDASLVEMTKLYDEGKAAGYEMDASYLESIDAEWTSLEEAAKENGYSLNDYVALSYGIGVNEKVFKDMYERYIYALTYAEKVAADFEVSASDIDTYYGEHTEMFDRVSYKSYFADGSAAEGEDAKAAMEKAKATAEAVLSGTETVSFSETDYVTIASVNPLYAEWLFDEARVSGDKEIFEAGNGYHVVEFVEVNDIHYNTVDVRHVLVAPETNDEAGLSAALSKANEYVAEWEANGKTEEAFAELAMKYSVDSSSVNGGLYENVFKGQMVAEFEDWCFDSARKPGDSEIVQTSYGYHIMYFSGVAEEFYSYSVDTAVRNERLNEYLDGIIEGVEASDLSGIKYAGKHFA